MGENGNAAHLSLRDRVAAAQDITSEQVYIEEWDATFEVRSMTGAERGAMFERMGMDRETGEVDVSGFYPEVIIATVFDPETGAPAFVPDDRDMLNSKSSKPLDTLAKVGLRLSGLDAEARKRVEATFPGA